MLLIMYYEKSTHFMYLILNLCYVQIYLGRLYREYYNRAVGKFYPAQETYVENEKSVLTR